MIDLDDPTWALTSHCYGSGSNVPSFLRRIENGNSLSKKFWDEFTNILCHQCTLGSASFAAFPHLVRIASEQKGTAKGAKSLKLAALILGLALAPENKLPRLDPKLGKPFREAIQVGRSLIAELYVNRKSGSWKDAIEFLSTAAAFMEYGDISLMLGEMSSGSVYCEECENEIDMTKQYTI